jgi:DNA-directed RNA polymerase specialized sigma24 family protein
VGRIRNADRRDQLMMSFHTWSQTPEAKVIAKRVCRSTRLGLDPDDLLAEAMVRICRRIARDPEGLEDVEIPAYCTTVMRHLVRDAWSRRPIGGVQSVDEFTEAVVPITDDAEGVAIQDGLWLDSDDLAHWRVAVEALGEDPVHVSAALSGLYLSTDESIRPDDLPWDQKRNDVRHRVTWPALWCATRDRGLFPSDGRRRSDGRARTRQRMLDKIDAFMLAVRVHIAGKGSS